MKYQVLFSLKNNKKVLINVVCCSRDGTSRVKVPKEADNITYICKIKKIVHTSCIIVT